MEKKKKKRPYLLCQGRSLNPYFCMTSDLNKTSPHFDYFISLWLLTLPSHVVPDVFFVCQIYIPLEIIAMFGAEEFFMRNTKMQKSSLWHQLRCWHHLRLRDVKCEHYGMSTDNARRLTSYNLAYILLDLTMILSMSSYLLTLRFIKEDVSVFKYHKPDKKPFIYNLGMILKDLNFDCRYPNVQIIPQSKVMDDGCCVWP